MDHHAAPAMTESYKSHARYQDEESKHTSTSLRGALRRGSPDSYGIVSMSNGSPRFARDDSEIVIVLWFATLFF